MREHRISRRCAATMSAAMLALPVLAEQVPAQDNLDSPVGLWRVLDEKTAKLDALVRIYPAGDRLEGKLENIFPAPGEDPDPICTRCEGDRHNQPKRGLVFMWGFTRQESEYTGGSILDPNTGGVYRAKLRLSDDGEKLMLHGYIGIPLFGRSQTWLRAH